TRRADFYPLDLLVQHYRNDADGLCCELVKGVDVSQESSSPSLSIPISSRHFQASKRRSTNSRDFIELLWQDGQPMLVTELLSKGSLLNYLRSRGQTVIMPENQIQFCPILMQQCIARDATCKSDPNAHRSRFPETSAAGMAYLAGKQLVHRDLAARNILLDDDCRAKRRSEQLPVPRSEYLLKWTAPECVKDHAKFSTKSDVWSFAVLLWEIYTFGRMPYPRIKTDQVLKHVLNGYRMEMPERCPSDVYKLMRRCWELTPEQRPNFDEIAPLVAGCAAGAGASGAGAGALVLARLWCWPLGASGAGRLLVLALCAGALVLVLWCGAFWCWRLWAGASGAGASGAGASGAGASGAWRACWCWRLWCWRLWCCASGAASGGWRPGAGACWLAPLCCWRLWCWRLWCWRLVLAPLVLAPLVLALWCWRWCWRLWCWRPGAGASGLGSGAGASGAGRLWCALAPLVLAPLVLVLAPLVLAPLVLRLLVLAPLVLAPLVLAACCAGALVAGALVLALWCWRPLVLALWLLAPLVGASVLTTMI
uniref:Protein kinase domain-containing protein n=1 Tax=Macrostomum lignano TaxID=282301 RepID=A0A1I8JNU1_9PLAT